MIILAEYIANYGNRAGYFMVLGGALHTVILYQFCKTKYVNQAAKIFLQVVYLPVI